MTPQAAQLEEYLMKVAPVETAGARNKRNYDELMNNACAGLNAPSAKRSLNK